MHGLSEVLYAFTSAANNNGSAFAGLTANTPWLNTALGVAMLLGRFVPIVLVLALAGSLAAQDKVPATVGHAADAPAAVRRPARRRRGRHHRTHLLPRSHAGSPGGRARLTHVHPHSHPRRRHGLPSPTKASPLVRLVAAGAGAPRRVPQAEPAQRCGATRHVPRLGRRRAHDRDRDRRAVPRRSGGLRRHRRCRSASPGASPSGSGSRCSSRTSPSPWPRAAARRRPRRCARPARARWRTGWSRTTPRRMPRADSAETDRGRLLRPDARRHGRRVGRRARSPATATSSRASRRSTSRRSPASPPRSCASPAATARAVTGGTRVLSDRIVVRITSKPGETFVDRMIALVEGAARQTHAQRDRAEHPAREPVDRVRRRRC